MNRRNFLRTGGLTALPVLAPAIPALANSHNFISADDKIVNFIGDGIMYPPDVYISKLDEIVAAKKINRDFYGEGKGKIARAFCHVERGRFESVGTTGRH